MCREREAIKGALLARPRGVDDLSTNKAPVCVVLQRKEALQLRENGRGAGHKILESQLQSTACIAATTFTTVTVTFTFGFHSQLRHRLARRENRECPLDESALKHGLERREVARAGRNPHFHSALHKSLPLQRANGAVPVRCIEASNGLGNGATIPHDVDDPRRWKRGA